MNRDTDLGRIPHNVGDWIRNGTLMIIVIGIGLTAIHFKPWQKIDVWTQKVVIDRLSK